MHKMLQSKSPNGLFESQASPSPPSATFHTRYNKLRPNFDLALEFVFSVNRVDLAKLQSVKEALHSKLELKRILLSFSLGKRPQFFQGSNNFQLHVIKQSSFFYLQY